MADAQSYWDGFYQENPFKDNKEPSSFLVDMKARLKKGKVLDIAMGEGSNAVYMALQGNEVIGFDISPVAIDRATKLATDSGVKVEAKQTDLDMYLMGLMDYDTIIMTRFKPPVVRYYNEIIRALKQGGTLLIESFTTEEMGDAIGQEEVYRDCYFKSNEVLRNLKGLKILFYNETTVDGKHIVQCLAQKPLDRDALKYDLFNMASKESKKAENKQLELAEKLFKK